MHTITNHLVELDDDGVHARGEAYNITWLQRPEGQLDLWFGRYLDRYERRGEEWRIVERVCVHEGDRTLPAGTPMPIDGAAFRQGDWDRPAEGRGVGPGAT